MALNHHLADVDIYTNSWGPKSGYGYVGPGSVSKSALYDGVTKVFVKKNQLCVIYLKVCRQLNSRIQYRIQAKNYKIDNFRVVSFQGRGTKGVTYVWAAGSGGLNDNCNGDGNVNSIYTIPITSVGADGRAAYYAEVCAPVFAATYSGNEHKTLVIFANIQDMYNISSSFKFNCSF